MLLSGQNFLEYQVLMKNFLPAAIALIIFLVPFTFIYAEQSPADSDFDSAVAAYENGDYKGAMAKLTALLDELKLNSIDKIIKAHSILGASYYFTDKEGEARSHFKTLLNFNPDYELPKNYFPPKVVSLFAEVKGVKKLEEIAGGAGAAGRFKDPGKTAQGKNLDTQNRFANCFIPFGYGQFKNNEPSKGYFFLTSQAITLASAITTLSIFKGIQNSDGTFNNPGVGNGLRGGFYSSLILFATFSLTGITDAIVSYKEFPYRDAGQPKLSFSIEPGENAGAVFLLNFSGF